MSRWRMIVYLDVNDDEYFDVKDDEAARGSDLARTVAGVIADSYLMQEHEWLDRPFVNGATVNTATIAHETD